MRRPFVLLIILGMPGSLLAQTPPADPATGKQLYDTFCGACHGSTGLGDGPGSAGLNPKPRNLQQTSRTDDELKKIIKEGGASAGLSPTMVGWGGALSDQDIANIVAHIRTLAKAKKVQ